MTLLARLVLRYIRNVDPEVLAELKRQLRTFNATSKAWGERPVPISDTAS